MSSNEIIFIIDDDKERCDKLTTIINFLGRQSVRSSYENPQALTLSRAKIVIVGAHPSVDETADLLHELLVLAPQLPVILIDLPSSTLPSSVQNVFATLTFPFSYFQLLEALHQCQIIAERKIATQRKNIPIFHSLVGESDAICQVRKLIEQVADTDASVLILGESGSGKEVVARNIHALSSRQNKPFIPINCGAIPAELLESELFGHEKGAFTGAITARQGRFELADGGSLFLDEIGDMPLAMQVKLLRVLQERCFERVGSNKSVMVDVRIIAATHRNLEQAIKAGSFREDLFYRLNVFPIDVPPLRARKNDLPLLFNELIARFENEHKPGVSLLPTAFAALSHYQWPGNVRELSNLVERLTILYPNGVVDVDDLPLRFRVDNPQVESGIISSERETLLQMIGTYNPQGNADAIDLKEHMVKTELALISQALDDADWVVAHAASSLNMRRTTLVEKMRKYGLIRPERA